MTAHVMISQMSHYYHAADGGGDAVGSTMRHVSSVVATRRTLVDQFGGGVNCS